MNTPNSPMDPPDNAIPPVNNMTALISDDMAQHNQAIAQSYDRQVYESGAFSFSSPGHLRAAAQLFGLESVPLAQARVLELGCAGGGNLLPFALAYPQAHVVGVDLSTMQVEQGQELVAALGIKNLHLQAMSLTDITPEFGEFDYIIAHGVFSWIPPEVRNGMLRVMRENLSPNGIAYISYNTYPGWKAGDIVRDAMLLHSHGLQDDETRLNSAKAVLNLLSKGIASNNAMSTALVNVVNHLSAQSDHYITHEYLETFNSPCYLLEFADLLQQNGLEHVGDAEIHTELAIIYGEHVQLNHSLVAMGQPRVLRQQYLDFAIGRNFRKSIVVHQQRAEQVRVSPDLEQLADLRWAGYFEETSPAEATPKGMRRFVNHNNNDLLTRSKTMLAVIQSLTEAWPATLDVDTLAAKVKVTLGNSDDTEMRQAVLAELQLLFRLGRLRYTLDTGPYDHYDKTAAMAKPKLVASLAYLVAKRHEQGLGIKIHNLWHETVNLALNDAERFLLPNLDGSRSTMELRTLLRDALYQGWVPNTDGIYLKGQRNLDAIAGEILNKLLKVLHKTALLLS
ncbi:methyltransferase domain-containing protein [Pectobacterium parmentieri]|uniref:Methyltransferase domain-containing protein n=1 Tax=Pectobacterium parmentieri TaxID=1905730 RepID=A0A8B3FMY5_PECPM|nr:class I SAM-dependent methyltransferase [Pectobacterium parmentieri]AOR59115.1 methyltransferase [Pectobacterium parmentieri]AYH03768.1 methyltransferase domain-containing protein [Pectobacterium parmentieri]AYH12586.1 methyltransferase domain-containing protein [Pectobacterium parmentieri]AYH21330.1 methyltransferase domain-containing protein [Pectobacterium parmentieri]AYH30036.1 methyltransferase domain-containing protein [Pectobacterium parmentieri]